MSNTIKVSVLGDIRDINKKMGQVTNSLGGFEKTSKRVGTMVKGLFAGLAVGQAVQGLKSVVDSASKAQQSLGATETVFGKYADTVIANSDRAAKALGLSANEYRELSNVTGALMNGAGVPMKRLAGLTDDLNSRAADMAATFGGTTKEAVEAISSLMKGEADPIERYGVSIKQSDVNARMAAKGLDGLTGSAKKQAEMQTRLEMLMDKTSKTQGAFKKESGTLAHQQQVLGAQWENMKATLGSALLPIITKVLTVVNDNFVPAFKAAAEIVKPIVARVRDFFTAGEEGTSRLQPLIDFLTGTLVPGFLGIYTALQGLWDKVLPIVEGIAQAFRDKWSEIGPKVTNVFNNVKESVSAALDFVKTVIETVTGIIGIIWDKWGDRIKSHVTNTFSNIMTVVGGALDVVTGIFKTATALLKGDWKGAWNGIKQILSGAMSIVKGIVKQGTQIIKNVMGAAWDVVKSAASKAWEGIKNTVKTAVGNVETTIKGLKGKVTGAVSGAASWLKDAGKKIIQGLIDGIDSMIDSVKGALNKITNKIPDWKGPKEKDKRLLTPTGKWIMAGLVKGLKDGARGVESALKAITDRMAKHFNKKYDSNKKAAAATKAAVKSIKDEYKALKANAKAQDALRGRLADARKAYEDLKKAAADYAKSIASGFKSYASLGNLNSAFTADGMAQQLQDRLAKMKRFAALMATLVKNGLNKDMVAELAAGGVEGGLAYAEALAAGGPAAIKEMNGLQTEINKTANTLGATASNDMYQAGINAAEGLVKGLEAKAKKLEKAAKRLAKAMVEAIKKALGIKSPSRVFKRLGEFTIEGMEIGLADTRGVTRSMRNLSEAMTYAYSPRLTTAAGTGNRGATNVTVQVNVPPTADKATIGREVASALDAFYKEGGRRANL